MSGASRPHAVVTGIGLTTPLGDGVSEFFDALCTGRSGLRRPPRNHPVASTVEVAGIARPIEAAEFVSPRDGLHVDRYVLLAMSAASDALIDAKLVVGQDVDARRVAVVVSTGGAGLETYERQALARHDRGRAAISPYYLPGMLPNMAAARIAIAHGIRGVSSSIATACAAGAQAVAEALRIIRAGEADVVVCGGSDAPLHPTVALGFANARALATGWDDDPAAASRPFDRRRNGFVLAEGAGILVVERREHANARGVIGYADLIGWGGSTDAHHPTTPRPDGEGAAECMRRALMDAGIAPRHVDYINAHGTSTKLGDVAETRAIHTVFGAHAPAVSSTKSVTGHMLGGAGAIEAAATAIAIAAGELPPTHNLTDPDPACDLNHIRDKARRADVSIAMSNSFGFGGHNISLLFGRSQTRTERERTTAEAQTQVVDTRFSRNGHSKFRGAL
ncbi:beta-ketoacyl-[acyl-carrier-protein] synthase family protein [Actinokineospora sp.]|uniref:beta-ketoacyl-[acyl-carrier-protein] synthase family protein n=1 Tax=Actinokineospora sp. TaxID=1872133 RepID=UPI004037B055